MLSNLDLLKPCIQDKERSGFFLRIKYFKKLYFFFSFLRKISESSLELSSIKIISNLNFAKFFLIFVTSSSKFFPSFKIGITIEYACTFFFYSYKYISKKFYKNLLFYNYGFFYTQQNNYLFFHKFVLFYFLNNNHSNLIYKLVILRDYNCIFHFH